MAPLAGWRIIGYFDRGVAHDIPRVPDPFLRKGDELKVLLDPTLDTPECSCPMLLSTFERQVIEGSVQGGVDLPWEVGQALYIAEGTTTPQVLDIDEIDKRMVEFVQRARVQGYKQIFRSDCDGLKDALEWFDRARRVSNEPDDYVRVYTLSQGEADQHLWLAWLKRYAPGLDIDARARELELPPRGRL